MSFLPRLRLWARRQASLIWLLALAYAAMPLAQALQPQAQWVDMPYCAGVVNTPPSAQHGQTAQGTTPLVAETVANALPPLATGVEQGHAPAHAHLLVLFTPHACPVGSGPQAALPANTAILPAAQPCAACTAPLQGPLQPATLAHIRPQTRAPPKVDTAA